MDEGQGRLNDCEEIDGLRNEGDAAGTSVERTEEKTDQASDEDGDLSGIFSRIQRIVMCILPFYPRGSQLNETQWEHRMLFHVVDAVGTEDHYCSKT